MTKMTGTQEMSQAQMLQQHLMKRQEEADMIQQQESNNSAGNDSNGRSRRRTSVLSRVVGFGAKIARFPSHLRQHSGEIFSTIDTSNKRPSDAGESNTFHDVSGSSIPVEPMPLSPKSDGDGSSDSSTSSNVSSTSAETSTRLQRVGQSDNSHAEPFDRSRAVENLQHSFRNRSSAETTGKLTGSESRRGEFEAALSLPATIGALSQNPFFLARNQDTAANGVASSPKSTPQGGPELNDLGMGIKTSLEFLNASDKDVRLRAGECISALLRDCSNSPIYEGQSDQQANRFDELSREEMNALKVLATSRISSLRSVAAGVLGDFAARGGFPRGQHHLKTLLTYATDLVQKDQCALQIFAIRIATDLSSKGPIWQERLIENKWFFTVVNIIQTTLHCGSNSSSAPSRHSLSRESSSTRTLLERGSSSSSSGSPSISAGDMSSSEENGTELENDSLPDQASHLQLTDEQKRLLKLAFEFIGKLNLDEAEKSLHRRKEIDLVEELIRQRITLIDLLTTMCRRLPTHTSLLRLLFGALGGLVRNLTNEQWDDLAGHFIASTLPVILIRAEEATTQYQHLASAILSQSMMQGDADEELIEAYEEMEEMKEGNQPFETGRVSPSHQPSSFMEKRNSTLSAFSFSHAGLQRQQLYRQNSQMTSSAFSMSSVGKSKSPYGSGGAGFLYSSNPLAGSYMAEAAANESKLAIAQRNAQQSSHLLVKKLNLVSLTIEALKVVKSACAHSAEIANATVKLFEPHGVMRALNMLYRCDVPGAKTEVAEFLYAICQNADNHRKIELCESGVIVRLIRLASPSSVYGKKSPGGLASSDETAFIPAINALACLASVDVIGARIIIAGGIGPLYSHANSTRPTRAAAREALDALGVSNLNDLIELWTVHRKDAQLLKEGDASDEEEDMPQPQPLSAVKRPANSKQHPHRLSAKPPSATIGHVATKSRGRNDILLAHRAQRHHGGSCFNSTRNFHEPSPQEAKLPRAKRIQTLIKSWHRDDGEELVMSLKSLRGDPLGKQPWDPSTVLGSGAFSTVYKAYLRKDQAGQEEPEHEMKEDEEEEHADGQVTGRYLPVAVKKLTEAAFADDSFLDEIKILSKVPAHRHITNLHGVIFSENTVLIVSELGGPHTLAWHLSTMTASDISKVSPLCTSWIARLKVLIGISEAFKTLQSMNPAILHLDLKSSNVLITDLGNGRFVPKLCDFGLAVELKPGYEFLSPANHGTLQWMAPEVMRNEDVELSKGFDQAADTFSFAILMWEVAHPGRVPWDELAVDVNLDSIQDRIRELVLTGRRLACFDRESWPKGYERIMRMCWRQNPADRPSFVRSFLTDPDSFSAKSHDANQETIGTTLTRMLWDLKSAKRVSVGANLSKPPNRTMVLKKDPSRRLVIKQEENLLPYREKSHSAIDSVAESDSSSINGDHSGGSGALQVDKDAEPVPFGVLPKIHSPKLRRQSSVINHSCMNPLLGANFDYLDFDEQDDEFLDLLSGTPSDADSLYSGSNAASFRSRQEKFRRHISNSVDENSLASHSVRF